MIVVVRVAGRQWLRVREWRDKQRCGGADWECIGEVARALSVPVIANGGIATAADVEACLAQTGAAAVACT